MSGLADTIYLNSPVKVQQMIVAGYGWWWYKRRFSAAFHTLVNELKSREHLTAGQFREYQEQRLRLLLTKAAKSKYYDEVFSQQGITISDTLSVWETFPRLPFLSKQTLRTRAHDLLTETPPPKGTSVFKSSGTTGTPTEIYYSPEMHAFELAVPEARNLSWAGVNYRDRRVMFGARKVCRFDQQQPPFWRFSPAEDLAYASIYHLSPRNLPSYIKFLHEFKPSVIMGYPNALNIIARYSADNKMPLPKARAVFTTSETVTEHLREAIETAWQCRIFDRYGAVECCMFASQCELGRYHVSPDVGIIEIIDENGNPCPPGVIGEIVCTGLHNSLQPLIRYRIGDAARWAIDQTCPCGRQMPILESIEGRIEDMCVTPDGRQILRFDTAFKGVATIKEAQVVQEEPDRFVVLVVPAEDYSEADSERIRQNMRLHIGDVKSEVQLVTSIPRTSSGKFKAVVSKLK